MSTGTGEREHKTDKKLPAVTEARRHNCSPGKRKKVFAAANATQKTTLKGGISAAQHSGPVHRVDTSGHPSELFRLRRNAAATAANTAKKREKSTPNEVFLLFRVRMKAVPARTWQSFFSQYITSLLQQGAAFFFREGLPVQVAILSKKQLEKEQPHLCALSSRHEQFAKRRVIERI